ncbi:hypothetical protein E2C01_003841 [Portunus trituberculatus]|uniref:Uncharacterized protein n=1 Tax=Portunus trituberculatus TaxID=210409 RepID=A0A5B7CN65_PORTR|nr:hypothetical protein [Portunus trituberculatus]
MEYSPHGDGIVAVSGAYRWSSGGVSVGRCRLSLESCSKTTAVYITDGKRDISIITVYIPTRTSAWNYEQYQMERTTEDLVGRDGKMWD